MQYIRQLLVRFFCDIRNNQGRGTETLIIWDITKTESDNYPITRCFEENNDKHTVATNLN